MSRHSWSQKDTFELIRLYEVNVPLWDTKHADYRDREVKTAIIRSIAVRMNVTTEEINRKLHNLRNQVSQELNKLNNKRHRGSSDEILTSGWTYFSALKFLIPNVINRSRSTDLAIQRILLGQKEFNHRTITTRSTSDRLEDEKTYERKLEKRRGLKRPAEPVNVSYEEDVRHTSQTVSKVLNEDDRFGEYVALELRSLRSEVSKRKLKSEIRRAICRIADLDDAGILIPSTSSNPSPPYSPPSPTYMPVCEITSVKSESII